MIRRICRPVANVGKAPFATTEGRVCDRDTASPRRQVQAMHAYVPSRSLPPVLRVRSYLGNRADDIVAGSGARAEIPAR